MKRRKFIQKTAASTAFISLSGLGLTSCTQSTATKITILHTNDVHSHIETCGPHEERHANKGGVARRAALVATLRTETLKRLLLDAGEIVQGHTYVNF